VRITTDGHESYRAYTCFLSVLENFLLLWETQMTKAKTSAVTVIVGASPNPSRYAYMAAELLARYGYEFVPVGIKKGEVFGRPILDIRSLPTILDVNTVTIYIRPELQLPWEDYIIALKPKRIIFNPGTENIEFQDRASALGIETIEACTLVMLNSNQY
jgi:uncharacterized protein